MKKTKLRTFLLKKSHIFEIILFPLFLFFLLFQDLSNSENYKELLTPLFIIKNEVTDKGANIILLDIDFTSIKCFLIVMFKNVLISLFTMTLAVYLVKNYWRKTTSDEETLKIILKKEIKSMLLQIALKDIYESPDFSYKNEEAEKIIANWFKESEIEYESKKEEEKRQKEKTELIEKRKALAAEIQIIDEKLGKDENNKIESSIEIENI